MAEGPSRFVRQQERISADSLHVLVQDSADGIMVVDADGVVCFANPAAYEVFGRGGTLVGEPFGVPLVAADKTDIDVPRADGEVATYELRVTSTRWGDEDAHIVALRDVTERVRSQARIAELNRELRLRAEAASVLSHVGDGVLLVDEQGVVSFWNPAAARVFGLEPTDAVGRPIAECVPGWVRVEREVELLEAPFEGRPRGQSVVLEVDGEELWLSMTGVRFAGGVVYAFHDLTEEVRVDTLKNDFIATASHELRTPLTSIYGAARTLQRSDMALDDEIRARLVQMICTQSQRLQEITDDILTARTLEGRQTKLKVEPFDAAALATDVIRTVAEQPHVGIEFELVDDLPADDRWIQGDANKVHQVLANLVQNAVKYSPEGGAVRLHVEGMEGCVQYTVRDEGMGIPRADLELIFQKFYRAKAPRDQGVNGTGLGLYIARELVRRMKGHLWVESRSGDGSAFYVRLPATPGTHAPAPAPGDAPAS